MVSRRLEPTNLAWHVRVVRAQAGLPGPSGSPDHGETGEDAQEGRLSGPVEHAHDAHTSEDLPCLFPLCAHAGAGVDQKQLRTVLGCRILISNPLEVEELSAVKKWHYRTQLEPRIPLLQLSGLSLPRIS